MLLLCLRRTLHCVIILMMAEFETLVRQAGTIGLSSDVVSGYVNQQVFYREKRAKERKLQILQIEAKNHEIRHIVPIIFRSVLCLFMRLRDLAYLCLIVRIFP